jgi:hypothetical protein
MRYLLICLLAVCAAGSFSGCSYSNNYKNYQTYQDPDEQPKNSNIPTTEQSR